jgi:CheY-like chemotaxis protein
MGDPESCPRSVLLVEDDDRIRARISDFLERRGYHVECAEDAGEAFDRLREIRHPCLVLIDLLTLRLDSTELLNALDRDDRLATLPIAVIPIKAPNLFSRPAAVKMSPNFEVLARIVEAHCCGGNLGGASDDQARVGSE